MCPAPSKTTDEDVVRAARGLALQGGPDAVSMQAVAAAVGVRAPSLYKRFPHKDALLDAVAREALGELQGKLEAAAARSGGGAAALAAMARAYRAFARRSPGLYALLFAARAEGEDVMPARGAAVAPVLAALAEIVAPDDRLPAARTLTAFLHGFVSMELGGAFHLGGDVQRAFDFGVAAIVRALGPPRAR